MMGWRLKPVKELGWSGGFAGRGSGRMCSWSAGWVFRGFDARAKSRGLWGLCGLGLGEGLGVANLTYWTGLEVLRMDERGRRGSRIGGVGFEEVWVKRLFLIIVGRILKGGA